MKNRIKRRCGRLLPLRKRLTLAQTKRRKKRIERRKAKENE